MCVLSYTIHAFARLLTHTRDLSRVTVYYMVQRPYGWGLRKSSQPGAAAEGDGRTEPMIVEPDTSGTTENAVAGQQQRQQQDAKEEEKEEEEEEEEEQEE